MKHYAPNVSESIVRKIVASFSSLRLLVDDGILDYPYSTREAVALVRHLNMFPDDGLVVALDDVLGFDSFDRHLKQTLVRVFNSNGIPLQFDENKISRRIVLGEELDLPPAVPLENWTK